MVTADLATAPAQDRRGPFRRLAGAAVKAGWDHVAPEQARTRLRTASSGIAMGIIEPFEIMSTDIVEDLVRATGRGCGR